ncbi:hypothetical protein J1G42_15485 [Cellulomonas sp. zg-ZUI222]|uniref:hypothetical protein n=1 Tax=Cellulomonas wangleii TaxID=2816956 RepID=UPI001A94F43D|nr:hypothetical protein [Cellulomonas wangleii]MBO0922225.1 hypothetical protein [Cellulomonas wangleii]
MSIVDDAIAQDVRTYAAQVREALADLDREQVDDLTDGLEANLTDALADERRAHRGSLVDEFGTPATYAAELRSAAGLAPAEPVPGRVGRVGRLLRAPDRRVREAASRVLARLRREPWWPPVEDLATDLRPVWWVLRGWVVYQVVVHMLGVESAWLPRHLAGALLLGGLVLVSAQIGRGEWFASPRAGERMQLVSVLAAVALVPVGATVAGHDGWLRAEAWAYRHADAGPSHVQVQEVPVDGVVVGGMPVSNLFVYDAAGNPLTDVQIYDDRGRQVRTTYDDGQSPWSRPDSDEAWYFAPAATQDGRTRWNVYPLRGWPESAFENDAETGEWRARTGVQALTPPYPFAKAPTLAVPGDGADGAVSDEATDDATDGAGEPADGTTDDVAPTSPTTVTATRAAPGTP